MSGKYIYESHDGWLYTSDHKIPSDRLYCDTCGDSDHLIGYAEDKASALKVLKEGSWEDCYTRKYILDFVNRSFPGRKLTMRLIAIEYPDRRLDFFKEQLAAAHRRLDWSLRHNPDCEDNAEKGEVVNFYEWAVQMAEEKAEIVKHARWKETFLARDSYGFFPSLEYYCSYCGCWESKNHKYCPNCGAKMDERSEDHD